MIAFRIIFIFAVIVAVVNAAAISEPESTLEVAARDVESSLQRVQRDFFQDILFGIMGAQEDDDDDDDEPESLPAPQHEKPKEAPADETTVAPKEEENPTPQAKDADDQ